MLEIHNNLLSVIQRLNKKLKFLMDLQNQQMNFRVEINLSLLHHVFNNINKLPDILITNIKLES